MGKIKKLIPNNLYETLRTVKAHCMQGISAAMFVFPIDRNKVVLSNFNGKGFGDNPKYLAQELYKRGKYAIYWVLNEAEELPDYITGVKKGSLACQYHMATAKLWIDNARKDPYYVKRKGQFYLQTWHGSIALKRIEKDVEDQLGAFYVKSAKRDAKMIDLMISNSTFSEKLYSKSFWYDGKLIKSGTPRLDCLFNQNEDQVKDLVTKRLKIPKSNLLVLYAPTFRNSLSLDAYDIDIDRIKKTFEQKTGKAVSIVVKLHPNLTLIDTDISFNGAVDASDYPDVYELLIASDVLITDYSSLMFEFPVAKRKPVFCYAKDINEYDRGFYFDIEKLPFQFAVNNDELEKNILLFDEEEYRHKINDFYNDLEMLEDGHAAERIVNYLEDNLFSK